MQFVSDSDMTSRAAEQHPYPCLKGLDRLVHLATRPLRSAYGSVLRGLLSYHLPGSIGVRLTRVLLENRPMNHQTRALVSKSRGDCGVEDGGRSLAMQILS